MLPKKWTQLHSLFCDLVSLEGASELMAPHPSSISASAMLLNLFCPPFTMSSPTLLLLLLLLLLQSTVTFTDFLLGPKTQNCELSSFLLLILRSLNYFSDFPPRPKTQNCELSCFLQLLLQSRTTYFCDFSSTPKTPKNLSFLSSSYASFDPQPTFAIFLLHPNLQNSEFSSPHPSQKNKSSEQKT